MVLKNGGVANVVPAFRRRFPEALLLADMKTMDPKTVAMFDKLANLATKAKNQLTFRFEGADSLACQIPLMELQQRGALVDHLVENACGTGTNRMVITPMPEVE